MQCGELRCGVRSWSKLFRVDYGSTRFAWRFIADTKHTADVLGLHREVVVTMHASYVVRLNDHERRNASSPRVVWVSQSDFVQYESLYRSGCIGVQCSEIRFMLLYVI